MPDWKIQLKRDADYWEDQVTVKDENGAAVVFADAEITIHPDDDSDDVIWSLDNGRLTMPADGVFGFEVPMSEIEAYEWISGKFCWSVTYSDGHVDGSWMIGRVTIKEPCL